MKVQHVPVEYIQQTWSLVENMLQKAFDLSPLYDEYNLEHLKVYLTQGLQTLLVWTDDNNKIHAAATIQWQNYPNERIAFVTSIGGVGVSDPDSLTSLETWVKANGGTKIRGAARESVARLWRQRCGFTPTYIAMEKQLCF